MKINEDVMKIFFGTALCANVASMRDNFVTTNKTWNIQFFCSMRNTFIRNVFEELEQISFWNLYLELISSFRGKFVVWKYVRRAIFQLRLLFERASENFAVNRISPIENLFIPVREACFETLLNKKIKSFWKSFKLSLSRVENNF